MDYSKVRGFNYQPSYGSTSLENWVKYDADVVELEMRRGKDFYPGFNTVRYWLSWDAYYRKPEEFKKNFEKSLQIAEHLGVKVIPCLLNRWHDSGGYDNGGIDIDNILYPECWSYYREYYKTYVRDIVSTHSGDKRILCWDICNEPFTYKLSDVTRAWLKPEFEWLKELYYIVKEVDKVTPAGVSIHPGHGLEGLELIEPISDIMMIHPYFTCDASNMYDQKLREDFEAQVLLNYEFGEKCGKPMIVTEAFWGANTDGARVEIIKFTLDTYAKYNLGFVAHALHYSLIADLHDEHGGFVGEPGYMAFINADGSMRAGHEIFNQY